MDNGDGHAAWKRTCSIDMDMHHGQWTCTMDMVWTFTMDMDMWHGQGLTA
jgi:hypothetical protein